MKSKYIYFIESDLFCYTKTYYKVKIILTALTKHGCINFGEGHGFRNNYALTV